MAATKLICPECNATLKPSQPVPDGKRVKCPKCGAGFAAPGVVRQDVFEVVETDEAAAPTVMPAAVKRDRPTVRPAKLPPSKPKPKKPAPRKKDPDPDEDEGGTYSFAGAAEEVKPDISYVPDTSIKDLRGPAMGHIVQPSNFLMSVAALSLVLGLFAIVEQGWPFAFSEYVLDHVNFFYAKYEKSSDQKLRERGKNLLNTKRAVLTQEELRELEDAESDETRNRVIVMVLFVLVVVYDGIIVMGAVKMQNMESRPWSMAAAIMTIIPVAGGGILFVIWLFIPMLMSIGLDDEGTINYITYVLMGLIAAIVSAIGGWALKVLLLPEVIDGFGYVAD
jgi:hypothetical protein